jgi:hypothetical protein
MLVAVTLRMGASHVRATAVWTVRLPRPGSVKVNQVQKAVSASGSACLPNGVVVPGVACELAVDKVGGQGGDPEPTTQGCAGDREVRANECECVRRS